MTVKRLQVGLAYAEDFFDHYPFLDHSKRIRLSADGSGGGFKITTTGGDVVGQAMWDGGYLTSSGQIANPIPPDMTGFSGLWCAGPMPTGSDMAGRQFSWTWDGRDIDITMFADPAFASGPTVDGTSGTGTATIAHAGNILIIGTVVNRSGNRSDPPRNFKIFQTRYASLVAAGNQLDPVYVNEVSQFSTLRMMDMQETNNNAVTAWSQMSNENDFSWRGQSQWVYDALYNDPVQASGGPRYGIPLSMMVKLCNAAGCNLWTNFPSDATDDYVTQFATYVKNNLSPNLKWQAEYTNEPWNFGFKQYGRLQKAGKALWSSEAYPWAHYYGYRTAQIYQIIYTIFGSANRSRWKGGWNVQTAYLDGSFSYYVEGFNRWKAATNNNSVAISDRIDYLWATSYFGYFVSDYSIQTVTKGANTTFNIGAFYPGSITVGDKITTFINASDGFAGANNVDSTILTLNASTGDVVTDLNSSAFPDFSNTSNGGSFFVPGFYAIARESIARNLADSTTYPTKYSFFNAQWASALTTGTGSFGCSTGQPLSMVAGTYWPSIKSAANSVGLKVAMYEGGSHWLGQNDRVRNETTFLEFYKQFFSSQPFGDVLLTSYQTWYNQAMGGEPAAFQFNGRVSQYGPWGKLQSWDPVFGTNDPSYVAIKNANTLPPKTPARWGPGSS